METMTTVFGSCLECSEEFSKQVPARIADANPDLKPDYCDNCKAADMAHAALRAKGMHAHRINEEKRIVLAEPIGEMDKYNTPEPYVVWTYNHDGDMLWGHYFAKRARAKEYYYDKVHGRK